MLSFSSNKTIKNLNEINRINCNIIIVRLILSQVKHFKHVVLKKCLHLNFKKETSYFIIANLENFLLLWSYSSWFFGVYWGVFCFSISLIFSQYIWFNLDKMKKKICISNRAFFCKYITKSWLSIIVVYAHLRMGIGGGGGDSMLTNILSLATLFYNVKASGRSQKINHSDWLLQVTGRSERQHRDLLPGSPTPDVHEIFASSCRVLGSGCQ